MPAANSPHTCSDTKNLETGINGGTFGASNLSVLDPLLERDVHQLEAFNCFPDYTGKERDEQTGEHLSV